MRKNAVVVLLLFAVVFCAQAVFAQTTDSTPCVQMRSEEETKVVTTVLHDIYPSLPESQRALIDQGLCFVGFYEEPLAHEVGAFGPEDDRFGDHPYKYPDTTLYPKGTIKVNLALNTLDSIRLAYRVNDAKVRLWLMNENENAFRHEIKHVQQYIKQPVLALQSADDCPKGICDAEKTEATKVKMGYELEAIAFGNEVRMRGLDQQSWDYVRDWLKNHPEILGDSFKDLSDLPPFEYFSQPVTPGSEFFYSAMYKPVVFAKTCAETGQLSADDKTLAQKFLTVNEKNGHFLEQAYPYLTPVFARISFCMIQTPKPPTAKIN